jgi:23S rRNA pseudouridine2457 synthase
MDKTHTHFILNKPYNFLCQFVNTNKRKKGLLGDLHHFPKGTMSIGRLDAKSEGLLLLTTNGKVSYHILSQKVEKEYWVQVDGIITQEAIDRLKNGVEIGLQDGSKYQTKPCEAFLIDGEPELPVAKRKIRDKRHGPKSWASVIVREGKFRQVRKMTAAVGFPTLRLVRVRIGNIKLNDLEPGNFMEVGELNV